MAIDCGYTKAAPLPVFLKHILENIFNPDVSVLSILVFYVQYLFDCNNDEDVNVCDKLFQEFPIKHTCVETLTHYYYCTNNTPTPMAQWLCHRLMTGRYCVRISVQAPNQSCFLKTQWVGVRPLHPLLSH